MATRDSYAMTVLGPLNPTLKSKSATGSVYITVDGGAIVRVSNHPSHAKVKCWQLRTDVSTNSKQRIFNIRDAKVLTKILLKRNKKNETQSNTSSDRHFIINVS